MSLINATCKDFSHATFHLHKHNGPYSAKACILESVATIFPPNSGLTSLALPSTLLLILRCTDVLKVSHSFEMLASIWVGFAINSLCIIWNSNQCGLECKMKGGQIHTSSPTIMNDLQWVQSYFCQEISGLKLHISYPSLSMNVCHIDRNLERKNCNDVG